MSTLITTARRVLRRGIVVTDSVGRADTAKTSAKFLSDFRDSGAIHNPRTTNYSSIALMDSDALIHVGV